MVVSCIRPVESPLANARAASARRLKEALVLAHAVVARSRIKAVSVAGSEVVRISFGKTLAMVRSLWLVLAAGNGIITGTQAGALIDRVMAHLADEILPEKGPPACQQLASPRRQLPRNRECFCLIPEPHSGYGKHVWAGVSERVTLIRCGAKRDASNPLA